MIDYTHVIVLITKCHSLINNSNKSVKTNINLTNNTCYNFDDFWNWDYMLNEMNDLFFNFWVIGHRIGFDKEMHFKLTLNTFAIISMYLAVLKDITRHCFSYTQSYNYFNNTCYNFDDFSNL